MKKVWKYTLVGHGITTITIPRGSEVLHVGSRDDVICAWILVPGEESKAEAALGLKPATIRLHTYFTGEDIHLRNLSYVGTVIRGLVTHVFQEK